MVAHKCQAYVYALKEKEPVFIVGLLGTKSYVGDCYTHYLI